MKSLDIKSFFLTRTVLDLNDFSKNPTSYIGGCKHQDLVDAVKGNEKKYLEDSLLMIEGSLVFKVGKKEIGGIPLFDDLATLYSYYLNAIEDFLKEEAGGFYYPSQPVKVYLEKINSSEMKISIDNQSLIANTSLLLNLILNSSESFFNVLVTQLKLEKYQYEIQQIKDLKDKLK